jgi:CheY-like chemotaxis protein
MNGTDAKHSIHIVMAEDDPDDRMLTRRALKKSRLVNTLDTVGDGEALMDYLKQRGEHADAERPGLILLDLNMPRMDGREALQRIKSDATLRRIPVIVLTTSEAEQDILESYDLGVNAYVTKPVTFEELVSAIQALGDFWFEIVKLPSDRQPQE